MGLNSLAGGVNDPPRYSMPVLIECAILGSPQQKLTYGELRITLKTRFRHFQREEDEGSKSWEVRSVEYFQVSTNTYQIEDIDAKPVQKRAIYDYRTSFVPGLFTRRLLDDQSKRAPLQS